MNKTRFFVIFFLASQSQRRFTGVHNELLTYTLRLQASKALEYNQRACKIEATSVIVKMFARFTGRQGIHFTQ